MFGRKTGVGVQIKSRYSPFLVQTHCITHRLNLACADAIKNLTFLKILREKFGNLYRLFSNSSNNTEKLKQMQLVLNEPEISVKELYAIR
jgi:hypothetical protein